MRVPGLDILPGLEDAYYKAVRFLGGVTGDIITNQKQKAGRLVSTRLATRSLMRQLKVFYSSYSQSRQQFWSEYGEALGLLPWASYVQVNYARIAQGFSPLHYPPVPVGNKILNGSFYGIPPSPWVTGPAFAEFKSNHVRVLDSFYGSPTVICYEILNLQNDTDYELRYDYYSYQEEDGEIGAGFGSNFGSFDFMAVATAEEGTHVVTLHTPMAGSQSIQFKLVAMNTFHYVLISKISLVQL